MVNFQYLTADDALDELMHGNQDSLRKSCIAEFELQRMSKTRPNFESMTYTELAGWWVTYMEWDPQFQAWMPKWS